MIDRKELDRLQALVDHFEERKNRARQRLESVDGRWWCFALLGFAMEPKDYVVQDLLTIRPVVEPPGEVELASALKAPAYFSTIARYSHGIQYELAVNSSFGSEHGPFTLAWWIVSAIRVRTLSEILVPVVADLPWSAIAAAPPQSVHAQVLEDVPAAFFLDPPVRVLGADLDWVFTNLTRFATLLETPSFRLAVESLTTHHHQSNLRMMTVAVWAGIEALFQIQAELRFRLSVSIAVCLEPPGEERLHLFQDLKRRYDFRSRAVHGAPVLDEDLRAHVRFMRSVLARLLSKTTEKGIMVSTDEIEQALLVGNGA